MKTIAWIILAAVVVVGGFFGYQSLTSSPQADGSSGSANAGGAPQAGASSGRASGASRGGRGGRPPPLIVASPVSEALINDRLKAVGNGTAKASVSVVPLSGGILKEVMVVPGQQVEANAVLARLDDEEQQIARDRAARAAAEADADARRLEELFRTRTTTQVEVNRARAALNDANLALRDSELKLARRTISAPISGVVGFVSVDKGNYITAQTELMTIDDRSQLVVEFWVPERFASQIELDQSVSAIALANPGTQYTGTISGIGSRIEPDSRTLPVRARVDNAGDALRPGMSFELTLNFPGQTFPAVNPLAIQWDSNGSYVWQVVDDKVNRVAARVVQRNPEAVLVEAELKPGDLIASEGLLALRQGASVRIDGATAESTSSDGNRGHGQSGDRSGTREGSATQPAASTNANRATGS